VVVINALVKHGSQAASEAAATAAGCSLSSVALAAALLEQLPCSATADSAACVAGVPDVIVAEHRWGEPPAELLPAFDVICACGEYHLQASSSSTRGCSCNRSGRHQQQQQGHW
jgi:hypothetical protein